MRIITGKTVIVTGASRGLGKEFVRQFVLKGNKVIAGCRKPDETHLSDAEHIHILQLDVSDPSSIEQFAQNVKNITPHVDVLVNNAGIYGPRIKNIDDITSEDMISIFKTNTIGPALIVQQLRRHGLLGGASTPSLVANITSKVGSIDDNRSGGGYYYRSSKIALNMINKSMSIDLASENIASTLLHPGWVKTDMTNGNGLIDVETSVSGMLKVMEMDVDQLNGAWHAYDGKVVPW